MMLLPMAVWGDTVKFKDGQSMAGVVRSIDAGKVVIEVGGQRKTIDILQVEQIDFDTAHVTDTPTIDEIPVREFTKAAEQLVKAEKETRRSFDMIKARWSTKKSVEPNQAQQWAADRERFDTPLSDYRKAIHQMYLDLAAHVDNYNKIAGDATKLYVGVKGILNVGSPLVRDNQRERPLKDFIPGHWYDQIYYDAYKKGFNDAVEFQALTPR
jgi:ribosomal protein L14E/L6E/L27E